MSTKVRKVGTVTLGVTLVAFGLAYLVQLFIPTLSCMMIMKAWPVAFIILGVEIILSNISHKEEITFVYDKTAIFLTAALVLFFMFMGALSMAIGKCAELNMTF